MQTALDAPPEDFDGPLSTFIEGIRRHGWFVTNVGGDGAAAGYSYTTGFWLTAQVPELVLFGMAPEVAHAVFADAYQSAQAGNTLSSGASTDRLFENGPAFIFDVAERFHEPYFGFSVFFYGRHGFRSRQIVWTDPSGAFPWQPAFDRSYADIQPDLSERGWHDEVGR